MIVDDVKGKGSEAINLARIAAMAPTMVYDVPNRSMFTLLNAGHYVGNSSSFQHNISSSIFNLFKPDETNFLLFDTVHLFKSIRWLNQKKSKRTFVLYASLLDLTELYSSESNTS